MAQEASSEKLFKPAQIQEIKEDPGFKAAISFVCVKTNATIYFESHQGKHVNGSWPGYNKKKDDVFSAVYLTRDNISALLKDAWKTLDPSLENKGGYWHVETNKPLDKDNNKQMTILTFQWKSAGENAYWIHGYPNHFRKAGRIDAYLRT